MRSSCRLIRILALIAAVTFPGCMHVQLSAANLLSPDEPPEAARLARGYAIEDFTIARADRLIGVTRAHADGNRAVIVFCGGDRFHRSREGGSVLAALARDADVVLFDYPGLGSSTGTPDPDSVLDNARAVLDYVARLPTTGAQKRVLYGFSLGGMVAAQLAREGAVDGLVLEGTAPSVASWVRSRIPWYAKPFVRVELDPLLARIDSVGALEHFRGRVLLLAGREDTQAPVKLSRDMQKRLSAQGVRSELHEIPHAGHGEIYRAPSFRATLDRFVASL